MRNTQTLARLRGNLKKEILNLANQSECGPRNIFEQDVEQGAITGSTSIFWRGNQVLLSRVGFFYSNETEFQFDEAMIHHRKHN